MKKLFVLAAIFALVLTGCDLLSNDGKSNDSNTSLPSLTIKNESSFDLTDVKFSGILFSTLGSNDLPRTTQSVKQLTANNVNNTGQITFIRKDIGIACRMREAITISEKDVVVTINNNTLVEELLNTNNKETLSRITFQYPRIAIEWGGSIIGNNYTINLGEAIINTSIQIEIPIKNIGGEKLTLTGSSPVKIEDANSIFFVVQPLSLEIDPNNTVIFKINFQPKAVQTYTAKITINSNNKDGDFTFNITGSGVQSKPVASVFYDDSIVSQNDTINAGEIPFTLSKNLDITIKNTGTELLTIDVANISITTYGEASFIKKSNPNGNISVGSSTSFKIEYKPNNLGISQSTLTIPTNDISRNPVIIFLQGIAVQGYTVIYNVNGGTGNAPASQVVNKGAGVVLSGGNGLSKTGYEFGGWNTNTTGTGITYAANSDYVPTDDITLYAKWNVSTTVHGDTLVAKLNWLKSNAISNVSYTIEINANESIAPQNLSYSGKTNISLKLISTGTERTISLLSNGSLFTINNSISLILDNNVSLKGLNNNNKSLVQIKNGGTLIMNEGSKITGNTYSSSYGAGVNIEINGNFIMNGGEISGNKAEGGAGVTNEGNFTLIGGKIKNNSASLVGGGVLNGGNFIMNGGEISDNTADEFGGGVCCLIDNFSMSGGKISGNYANYGGGVYVQKDCNFIFNNGIISENNAEKGGGVNIDGTFKMNGGSISGNNALTFGGGVYIDNGTVQMSGGIVYGDNASTTLKNTAQYKVTAALYNYNGTAQYGRLNGISFINMGNIDKYNSDTIKVVNGNLIIE